MVLHNAALGVQRLLTLVPLSVPTVSREVEEKLEPACKDKVFEAKLEVRASFVHVYIGILTPWATDRGFLLERKKNAESANAIFDPARDSCAVLWEP
eukprot:1183871-Prorocentrum_minimum.AAC.3